MLQIQIQVDDGINCLRVGVGEWRQVWNKVVDGRQICQWKHGPGAVFFDVDCTDAGCLAIGANDLLMPASAVLKSVDV